MLLLDHAGSVGKCFSTEQASLAHVGAQRVVQCGAVLPQEVAEVVVVRQVPHNRILHVQEPAFNYKAPDKR